jgi:hypothetical protein
MKTKIKSENSGKKQDTRFKPGQSGNPKGKPRGAKNHATKLAEKLIDNQCEALVQKAVEMALNGDMQALKLLIERLIPARKDRPVKLDLPKIQSAQDIINVMGLIVENVGKGELEPEQAKTLATILELNRKSIETAEIEERLLALERRGKVE